MDSVTEMHMNGTLKMHTYMNDLLGHRDISVDSQ